MSAFAPMRYGRPHLLRDFARITWLALFTLQLVIFVAGMMVWFPRMQQACGEALFVCQQRGQATVAEEQAFRTIGWSLEAYAWYALLTRAAQKLIGIAVGVLIFWRKPDDRLAWIASMLLITGIEASVANILVSAQPQWALPAAFLTWVGIVCFALFFYLFPTGHFVPRWTRWAALAWSVLFFFSRFFPLTPLDLNYTALSAALIGTFFSCTFLGAQLYQYRYLSGPVGRQQTKWVVLALVVGILAQLAAMTTVQLNAGRGITVAPYFLLINLGFSALVYLLPVAIGFAIFRYRLFEIDLIVRRTLTYALLTGMLVLIYFGSVVFLESALRTLTGETSEAAVVISTLVIAALFSPLRRRVQGFIDKRLYRGQYDAQATLAGFSARLRERNNADLDHLAGELTGVIQSTVQPAHLSLWLAPVGASPQTQEVRQGNGARA